MSASRPFAMMSLLKVDFVEVPLLATILGLPTGTTGTAHRGRVCLLKGRAGMVPTISASGTASSPATRPARARSTPTEPSERGAEAGAGASAGGSRGWVDAVVLETSIADFLLPFIPPGRYCRTGLATSVVRLPEQQDILPAVRSCTAKWKVASEEVLQSVFKVMESRVRAHFTVEMDSDSELSDSARTRVLELDDIQEGVKHMLKVMGIYFQYKFLLSSNDGNIIGALVQLPKPAQRILEVVVGRLRGLLEPREAQAMLVVKRHPGKKPEELEAELTKALSRTPVQPRARPRPRALGGGGGGGGGSTSGAPHTATGSLSSEGSIAANHDGAGSRRTGAPKRPRRPRSHVAPCSVVG